MGFTLIVGALRHGQQVYNLKGAAAYYLAVIVPLAGLGIMLPRYTTSAPGGEASTLMAVFLILMSVGLWGVFLAIQTMRHRSFFMQPETSGSEGEEADHDHGDLVVRSLGYHALFLPLTMLPIVLLSKKMAALVDHGIATLGAPQALGIGLVTGKRVELGLDNAEAHLLLITLLVSVVNFNTERTNVLQGFVHLILFLAYIVLIFD